MSRPAEYLGLINERDARERHYAERVRFNAPLLDVSTLPQKEMGAPLSPREWAELRQAIERFIYENPGMVPDLRKP